MDKLKMFHVYPQSAIEQVQADHVQRQDVPVSDLKPRKWKRRSRPNTALINEAVEHKHETHYYRAQ